MTFGFHLPAAAYGSGKAKAKVKASEEQKQKIMTDALGKPLTASAAKQGTISDEFAEETDEHFVFTPGSTLRDGRYAKLEPLGSGVFARVVSAR